MSNLNAHHDTADCLTAYSLPLTVEGIPLQPSSRPEALGRLGVYHILDVLGRGGMGLVFKAVEESLDRVVALKVIRPELAAEPAMVRRFQDEARSAARLRHENIVTVYAVGEVQGLLYLAMEYSSGPTLVDVIADEQPVAPERIVGIGFQIARALATAHEAGIIHRDIKPGNILIESRTQIVRVVDFGLARGLERPSSPITRPGVVLGTPEYMSPEQALGEPLDGRSDIYSLGAVLYELATGELPITIGSKDSLSNDILTHHVEPVRELNRRIPPELAQIIERCLAKKPRDRFTSAAELAQALQDLGLADLPTSLSLTPVNLPRHRPRFRRWAGAAAACLLVGAGLTFYRPARTVADMVVTNAAVVGSQVVLTTPSGQEVWQLGLTTPVASARIIDLDNDRIGEVLTTTCTRGSRPDCILVYENDGRARWRHALGPSQGSMVEPSAESPIGTAAIGRLEVLDLDQDGRCEIVAVVVERSRHSQAARLLIIDSQTGRTRGDYWHPGSLDTFVCGDLDNDGIIEIVAFGTNEHFQQPGEPPPQCLMVLKGPKVSGQAPPYLAPKLTWGGQTAYALFRQPYQSVQLRLAEEVTRAGQKRIQLAADDLAPTLLDVRLHQQGQPVAWLEYCD